MQSILYLATDPIDPASGFTIDKHLKIGNSPAGALDLARAFEVSAGTEDFFQLRSNPVYAYVRNGFDGGTIDETNAAAHLRLFVVKTQLLMLGLWLVKDNSANPWRVHLRIDDVDGAHHRVESFSTQFSMANCELATVHFTRSELERAVGFYRKLWDVIPRLPEDQTYLSGLALGTRLSRALYFVQAARNAGDLLIKLAFYCMCLETLFTTASGRHSHVIPTHASVMLGKTRRERQQPYDDVYALYGYRSDVVHGKTFDTSGLEEIRDTVQRCDDYVRRILSVILTDVILLALFQTGSQRDIGNHFKQGPKEELPRRASASGNSLAVDNRR